MKHKFSIRPRTAGLGLGKLARKHKREFAMITNKPEEELPWDFRNNLGNEPVPAHNVYFDRYSLSNLSDFKFFHVLSL